jgi:hypothetical protein
MDKEDWATAGVPGLNKVELDASAASDFVILHFGPPRLTALPNRLLLPSDSVTSAAVRHYISVLLAGDMDGVVEWGAWWNEVADWG